jgi:hypothetical protein
MVLLLLVLTELRLYSVAGYLTFGFFCLTGYAVGPRFDELRMVPFQEQELPLHRPPDHGRAQLVHSPGKGRHC